MTKIHNSSSVNFKKIELKYSVVNNKLSNETNVRVSN